MSEHQDHRERTWSNLLQGAIVIVAVVLGFVALFVVTPFLGRLLGKALIVIVPVAIAAAAGIGSRK